MHTFHHSPVGGRHELGQNFLTDQRVIAQLVDLIAATHGPIVEIGAGSGALTRPLARLGRPLTAIEIDPTRTAALRGQVGANVTVVTADGLRYHYPTSPYVVVSNVPFHLTTAILRMLLGGHHWTDATLLTQWEVARRRCGVGGSTLLTAQWLPWYEFVLHGRVPARAFRPAPAVAAGLFQIRRRDQPLLSGDRAEYHRYVASVFHGRGRGLGQILARTARPLAPARIRAWLRAEQLTAAALPRDLSAEQWASLWALVEAKAPAATRGVRGGGTPRRGRSRGDSL